MTFADAQDGGDGIIIDTQTREYMATEHVFIRKQEDETTKTVEDLTVEAVEHKVEKGVPYAQGKNLVIFSDAIGLWTPDRVGRRIAGRHNFDSVWTVCLAKTLLIEFVYCVAKIYEHHSPKWEIIINLNFTNWEVRRIP